jgi:hypothetical protein
MARRMQSSCDMKVPFLALAVIAGCSRGSSMPHRPLGVQGNLEEAEQHEHDADLHDDQAQEAAARTVQQRAACGDRVLGSGLTSGGEQQLGRSPCWTAADDEARHREAAADLRHDAAVHRAYARELAQAELDACVAMPTKELDHTPFFHRADIAAVTALVERGHVRGARIRFRAVPGLTVDWLRAAIACHQARAAALGWPEQHFAYDPTMVPGTTVSVEERGATILVVVRADDDVAAHAAYGRAEGLLDPREP